MVALHMVAGCTWLQADEPYAWRAGGTGVHRKGCIVDCLPRGQRDGVLDLGTGAGAGAGHSHIHGHRHRPGVGRRSLRRCSSTFSLCFLQEKD